MTFNPWIPIGRPFIPCSHPERHCASHLDLILGVLRTHLLSLTSQILCQTSSGFWGSEPGCVYTYVTVLSTPVCGCSEYVCLCVLSISMWVASTYVCMHAPVPCLYPGRLGGTLSCQGKSSYKVVGEGAPLACCNT